MNKATNIMNSQRNSLETSKLKKENIILFLTIIVMFGSIIVNILQFFNLKDTVIDFSKKNNLTPHITNEIQFKGKNTTAVKFRYVPKKNKNQGYKIRILKNQYVVIKSTNDIDVSILDSNGDYVSLVSFKDKNWVFQTSTYDYYIIVFGGNLSTEITIDIPPLSKDKNIMMMKE